VPLPEREREPSMSPNVARSRSRTLLRLFLSVKSLSINTEFIITEGFAALLV
jgi:hypothetical protein